MEKDPDRRWRMINELTAEFGVTTRALRFYEDEGLLAPRREGRRRLYSPRDRARLSLILRGKRLGFSLAEIRDMIECYDAPMGEAGQIRGFLERLALRRAGLEQKRRDLEESLSEIETAEQAARARLAALMERAGP